MGGWGGFTTRDLARCRTMARFIAPIYNWWNLFVRLAEPDKHLEAITSRPLLLAGTYIAEYNRLFAIEPLEEGTAFVADTAGVWRETLCVVEDRVVGNDNSVAWAGRRLRIPPSRLRPHFVKASVRVHEYPDGTVSVFLGPHRVAAFDASGAEMVSAPAAMSLAPCSEPSRPSPAGRAKGAALTAPPREALTNVRAGTEKRASSRTKKHTSGEFYTVPA